MILAYVILWNPNKGEHRDLMAHYVALFAELTLRLQIRARETLEAHLAAQLWEHSWVLVITLVLTLSKPSSMQLNILYSFPSC